MLDALAAEAWDRQEAAWSALTQAQWLARQVSGRGPQARAKAEAQRGSLLPSATDVRDLRATWRRATDERKRLAAMADGLRAQQKGRTG